jgi:uncharacterized protein YqhQ
MNIIEIKLELCLSFFHEEEETANVSKIKKNSKNIHFLCVDDFFAFIIIISLLLLSHIHSVYVFFFRYLSRQLILIIVIETPNKNIKKTTSSS